MTTAQRCAPTDGASEEVTIDHIRAFLYRRGRERNAAAECGDGARLERLRLLSELLDA